MNRAKKFLLATLTLASFTAVALGVSACDDQQEHAHQWSDWAVTSAPTDEAEGKATRTCSGAGNCDASAADKEYTLPALGADYSMGDDSATCTAAGSVTYSYNKNGVSISFSVATEAKGHGTLTPHDAEAANCIEDGHEAYWECPDCGWLFSDAEGENKIDAPVAVPARGSHGTLEKVDADMGFDGCSGSGTLEYHTCPDCGWLFSDAAGANRIDVPVSVSHQNATKVDKEDATCVSDGHEAYWTCPDCEKSFTDEACIHVIDDDTDLTIPKIAHDIVPVEGVGATCDEEGYHDHYKCNSCGKLYSDADGVYEIENVVKILKHSDAATDSNVANKTVAGKSFKPMTQIYCPDCGEYVVETKSNGVVIAREKLASDLLYRNTQGYYLLFDKDAGEIAKVNLGNSSDANKGFTFVAPQAGIYTFTIGGDASISVVKYADFTVYENGWKDVAPAEYFDKTSDTLTTTVTFEVPKNAVVIIKLSSGNFTATYTYEKSTAVHLNRAYAVEPTTTNRTATLKADVPAAGTYLLTVSHNNDFDSTATFTVEVGTDTQTAINNIPVYVSLSPNVEFLVTCNQGVMIEGVKYTYTITITPEPEALTSGNNTVKVTVANSTAYTDAYYFVADTDSDEGEAYNFEVSAAGYTVTVLGKGVTVTSTKAEKIVLTKGEKVILVVTAQTTGSCTLKISLDESGFSHNTISAGESVQLTATGGSSAAIVQADVVSGTYQVAISGYSGSSLYFGKNANGDASFNYSNAIQLAGWMSSNGSFTVISKNSTSCLIQITLDKGDTLEIYNTARGGDITVTLTLTAV